LVKKNKPKVPSTNSGTGYEEISHTADLALRVWGKNLEALFVNAAAGMTTLMIDTALEGGVSVTRSLSIEAMDAEALLVEWLSEVAYLAESEGAVFHLFSIAHITETELKAVLQGQLPGKLKRTIKAVTYHRLKIIKTDRGVEATVVFDV
jgi:SHS2 domain-containing protein